LLLSGATDDDLPLIRSWLTLEMAELPENDDLIDQRKPFLVIMIHDLDDNKVGFFNVFNVDFKNRKCEFGVVIATAPGRRMLKRAVLQLADILFNGEDFNRIYIKILTCNIRLIRLAQMLGFVVEGIEREAVFKNGHLENVTILALLKNDFNGR
jgi:RimJ/RimL family protein N-acetyltransferase